MFTRVRGHRAGRWAAALAARIRVRVLGPVRAHPVLSMFYRVLIALLGLTIVAVGILLIPAPGPGWLVVIGGLWVLATEFAWARRLLNVTRSLVRVWTRWVMAKPPWMRSLAGLAGVALLAAVVLLSLKAATWNGFPFD